MAVLRIPEKFRAPLVLLATFNDDQLATIARALESAPPAPYSEKTEEYLAQAMTFAPPFTARLVGEALMMLFLSKCDSNKQPKELATDVADFLAENPGACNEDEILSVSSRGKFVEAVVRLLSVHSFDVNAKTTSLLSEYQHLLHRTRTISDVRYVFESGDTPEKIAAGVVVHSLRVDYFVDGEPKQIFFALDRKDIEALIGDLQRALKKEETLRAQIKATGVAIVNA